MGPTTLLDICEIYNITMTFSYDHVEGEWEIILTNSDKQLHYWYSTEQINESELGIYEFLRQSLVQAVIDDF